MVLSFARGLGWGQLLCVMTKLPASFRWPAPRFDFFMSYLLWVIADMGLNMWKSGVEIGHVTYLDCIVAFKVPYHWASVDGGTLMRLGGSIPPMEQYYALIKLK